MTEELELALRGTFSELTREELINLAIILIDENLHRVGRKPKVLKGETA